MSCKREDRPGRPLFAYSPSRSGAFIRGLEPNLDTNEVCQESRMFLVRLMEVPTYGRRYLAGDGPLVLRTFDRITAEVQGLIDT
jgi:hypothetical protein